MDADRAGRLQQLKARALGFTLLVVALASLVILLAESPVSAEPEFLTAFGQRYPAAAASQLNGCLLCHTTADPTEENLNQYGDDWEERGDKSFASVEGLDSDRDGFTNLQEIQSLSFPGDSASTPLTVTTTTTVPGQAPDGAALYAASCAACHGPDGGNLRNTSLSSQQFVSVTTNGQGSAMPAFGLALSEAQIAAIYAYVTGAPAPTTTTTVPGTPVDAGALYAATCAGCHGADGGNLVPTALSSSEVVAVIANGRGSMPGYSATLSAGQIQALADYLLARSAVPTTTAPPSATPRSGSAVYAASCAGCHGASGGNLVGTTLSTSQLVSVISDGTGTMAGFRGVLPPAEIDAVARYLRSLAASTTTTAPGAHPDAGSLYMRECAVCHGLHGEGGSGGALFGTSAKAGEIESIIADGSGSMPGFASKLNAEELRALVAFVVDLSGVEPEPEDTEGDGTEEAVQATTSTSSTTTTTTEVRAIAAAPSDVLPTGQDRSGEAGRAGSPWVVAVPLLLIVGWVVVDAVRHGVLRLPGSRA